jgi:hypothetical protein
MALFNSNSMNVFKVGDTVVINKMFVGEITYIDHKNEQADVEWEEIDGFINCGVFSLARLELI